MERSWGGKGEKGSKVYIRIREDDCFLEFLLPVCFEIYESGSQSDSTRYCSEQVEKQNDHPCIRMSKNTGKEESYSRPSFFSFPSRKSSPETERCSDRTKFLPLQFGATPRNLQVPVGSFFLFHLNAPVLGSSIKRRAPGSSTDITSVSARRARSRWPRGEIGEGGQGR